MQDRRQSGSPRSKEAIYIVRGGNLLCWSGKIFLAGRGGKGLGEGRLAVR